MSDYNVPIAPRVSLDKKKKRTQFAEEASSFAKEQAFHNSKTVTRSPLSFTPYASFLLQIHQAYVNDVSFYNSREGTRNMAQSAGAEPAHARHRSLCSLPNFAAAAPPPPPPPPNLIPSPSPKRWPSSQTAAVDAVAAAWAAAAVPRGTAGRARERGRIHLGAAWPRVDPAAATQQQQPSILSPRPVSVVLRRDGTAASFHTSSSSSSQQV